MDDVERQAFKEEIKDEIAHDARRKARARFWWSLAIVAVVVLTPILLVAAALAKTGLVAVPVLSSVLYHPRQPQRLVRPIAGATPESVIQAAAYAAKLDPVTRLATVHLTEAQLTTVVDPILQLETSLPFHVVHGQVAIDADAAEAYAAIASKDRQSSLLVVFHPRYDNGVLSLNFEKIAIGDLDLPGFLLRIIETRANKAVNEAFAGGFSGAGKIASLTLTPGVLDVALDPFAK